jgi:hypothetical protein
MNGTFKNGQWVNAQEHGTGIVVWDVPNEKGEIRVHFCYEKAPKDETCIWLSPDLLTVNNNTHPAKDMNGLDLSIGDRLYYPMAKGGAGNGACIKEGAVEKIEEPTHRGYGYWTRKLKIRDYESNKIVTHNYPANCLKCFL